MIRTQRWLVLGLIAMVIGLMLFGWWSGTGQDVASQATRLIAIGRLAGIVATISVLLELLVMSRAPFIERNFDLEEINDFHRYNGYTMTYALIAHIVFLVMGYGVTSHLGWWPQFLQLNTAFEDVLKATIGSVAFFGVAITSLHMMRKRLPYEVWYFMHLVVYGGIVLAFGHQINSGGDIVTQNWMRVLWIGAYGLIFGLVAYYRFVRHVLLYMRHRFVVSRLIEEAPGIYSIYITGRDIQRYNYQAGQYAHWRFLSKDLFLESHPFSFSSSPHSNELRFTFKASGDYTQQLAHVAPGTSVLIDGPRGSFTLHRAPTKNVLLIAGGIGVAPFIPAAKALLKDGKAVQVLYSVTNRSDIAFGRELTQIQSAAQDMFGVAAHVSSERGRINEAVLSKYIGNYGDEVSVYLCGPDAMTLAVKKMLPGLGVPQANIIAERFTF